MGRFLKGLMLVWGLSVIAASIICMVTLVYSVMNGDANLHGRSYFNQNLVILLFFGSLFYSVISVLFIFGNERMKEDDKEKREIFNKSKPLEPLGRCLNEKEFQEFKELKGKHPRFRQIVNHLNSCSACIEKQRAYLECHEV